MDITEAKKLLHNAYYESQSFWRLKEVLDVIEEGERLHTERLEHLVMLESQCNEVLGDILRLESDRAGLMADITQAQAQLDTLQAAIADIQFKFQALLGGNLTPAPPEPPEPPSLFTTVKELFHG